ncbi:MAG: gamma-glutamyltransferase [Pseudomonadota bacterium]
MIRMRLVACFVALASLLPLPQTALGEYPPPAVGKSEMVASAQAHATEVGLEILRQGGNAIDAAVAMAYALAVVHPCCGNLGGGGFMTIHLAAENNDIFLNFRERAPLAASTDMYLDQDGNVDHAKSLNGYLAVGVPGTVLGLQTALEKYGTMNRGQVIAPALKHAEEGYVLDLASANILAYGATAFRGAPNVAAIYLKDGQPHQAGDRFVQADLAKTLKLISEYGADAFYEGPVAKAIVAASDAAGGILSLEDFAQYTVEELDPVRCRYRGYEIVSAPPPSSGGTTICLILNQLEGYPLGHLGYNSAETIHYMVEAMRRAFADRNSLLGDPNFVDNPLERLLSDSYAAELRATIPANRATPIGEIKADVASREGQNTTHLSVMDKAGNAVSLTYTINSYFGAKVIAGNTGFFLNNEMNDFTAKPGVPNMFGLVQGTANAIQPGKRPLSSMSPTLIKKDGEVVLVLGSPGGSRIITIVVQGIVNVIDFDMNLSEAVNSPRIHNQWLPDRIFYEPRAFTKDTQRLLEQMGYHLVEQRPWGAMEAIMKVPASGLPRGPAIGIFGDDSVQGSYELPGHLYGVNDARRPAGLAAGR